MRTVYKYIVPVNDDVTEIDAPIGLVPVHAELVGTEMGGRAFLLWMDVETERAMKKHKFCVTGTGHPVGENFRHVASSTRGVPFVWHLWEGK